VLFNSTVSRSALCCQLAAVSHISARLPEGQMDWLQCDMVTLGGTVYLTPAYLLSINFFSQILQLAAILSRARCDSLKLV